MNTLHYRVFKMAVGFSTQSKWHVVAPAQPGFMPLTQTYDSFAEAMADLNAPARQTQKR